jgi:predicted nucleic acid-binding protein
VLTRLPHGQRLSPGVAAEAIAALDLEPLGLAAGEQKEVIFTLASAGLAGGAGYDGLIAQTAKAHDVTLLSLDRRAASAFEAIGVDFRLI